MDPFPVQKFDCEIRIGISRAFGDFGEEFARKSSGSWDPRAASRSDLTNPNQNSYFAYICLDNLLAIVVALRIAGVRGTGG